MTNKEDIKNILISLKGIGEAKADALIKAGFTSVKKITAASIDDLTAVQGISETVATSLQNQLQEHISAEEQKETKKPSEQTKQPPATTPAQKEPTPTEQKPTPSEKPVKKPPADKKEGYEPKKKPVLPDDIKHVLPLRKEIKKKTPAFHREEWFRYKRLGKKWRRPDGISSKMRRNLKYRPNRVRVGYRGPEKTRGLHPSGFQEIMVYTLKDLDGIDPKTQAARIGGTVGMRKRIEIEKKAKELDVRILNTIR